MFTDNVSAHYPPVACTQKTIIFLVGGTWVSDLYGTAGVVVLFVCYVSCSFVKVVDLSRACYVLFGGCAVSGIGVSRFLFSSAPAGQPKAKRNELPELGCSVLNAGLRFHTEHFRFSLTNEVKLMKYSSLWIIVNTENITSFEVFRVLRN